MLSVPQLLSAENPVFRAYLFYGSILALKLLAVVLLVGRYRWTKKIFISPEDANAMNNSKLSPIRGFEVKHDDPDVERCRRAHLNDLENILVYLIVSLFYTLTDPNTTLALNLFRVYTGARIVHTFVYAVVVIPQPARFLAFIVGYLITIYMAVCSCIQYY